jgi:hypothetical protein
MYSNSGEVANGAGMYLFSGVNNGGSIRRALLRFEVTDSVPSDATITEASLQVTVTRGNDDATYEAGLHRVLAPWSEGSSLPAGNGGGGAQASEGDVTWIHRSYSLNSSRALAWVSAGGDIDPTPLATTTLADSGPSLFADADLTAEVQVSPVVIESLSRGLPGRHQHHPLLHFHVLNLQSFPFHPLSGHCQRQCGSPRLDAAPR